MTTNPSLIVMYHYVRPDQKSVPAGIRPLRVSEFERQLDWLCERYDVVSAEEFLRRATSSNRAAESRAAQPPDILRNPPGGGAARLSAARGSKPACLLTFDDGTKDHAQVVAPILARRGLSGVFFVLTWPMELGKMPLTHAIHWLLGSDDAAVWETFERYARYYLGGLEALGNESDARRIYHYETPLRARIKYAANMALPAEATEQIVATAIRRSGRSVRELAEEWFVNTDDIRAMDAAGMTIAMHGCSHRSLQTLGADGIRDEIRHCSNYLTNVLGKKPTWYACPFGGSGASLNATNAMRSAMEEASVVGSVSTEKRWVTADSDSLALPRIDAIDLPPRRAELVAA
jgi:peptidoglycan/xylan/chitin deacetylase (PgdA/CDA1 family)